MFTVREVQRSPELERILALPRRTWTKAQEAAAIEELTARFRRHGGSMRLRGVQARALWEVLHTGGLVGPIRVGGGKTLLSLLIFVALRAVRGVLLVPAALAGKTEREFDELAHHWYVPTRPYVMSYEALGREKAAKFLETYRPDVIVADEAHRLKNRKAACTRRVERHMKAHPETRFIAISGTLIGTSLLDATHLISWALKENSPVPRTAHEASEWAAALDEGHDPMDGIMSPGALLALAVPGDTGPAVEVARRGFRDRFLSTPGVVSSDDGGVGCSLRISDVEYEIPPDMDAHFRKLRNEWTLPDGWTLTQAVQAWQHARELALGMYNVWDPRPPVEWLRARSEWAAYVREVLKTSRTLDSELMVRDAVLDGRHPEGAGILEAWLRIAPTFTIQPRPEWHGTFALEACERWMKQAPGIVWTGHTFFAQELARRTGAPYYGPGGVDSRGRPIEAENGKSPIIASIAANSTGRNLQRAFSRNLITAPTSSGKTWEQLLGRTHRDGQTADEVIVDVLLGCREHYDALVRARAGAAANEQMTGHSQKLLIADVLWPGDVTGRSGARWASNAELGSTSED